VLPSGAWRCTLHNQGPPIPPDVLPHVFELFFSTKRGGTGVGLALCQRIMDEHGGMITLDNSEGYGTTVTITLPEEGGDGGAGRDKQGLEARSPTPPAPSRAAPSTSS
jgi:signal transduction histidine kinase